LNGLFLMIFLAVVVLTGGTFVVEGRSSLVIVDNFLFVGPL